MDKSMKERSWSGWKVEYLRKSIKKFYYGAIQKKNKFFDAECMLKLWVFPVRRK